MKTITEKTHSIKFAAKLFVLFASVFLSAGCSNLSDILNPPPPPPPPPAVWNSAPGFSADAIDKIAIITEDGTQNIWGSSDPLMTSIEDVFISAAFRKGYRVSDRSDVDRVLQEIRFQQSGLTETDVAKLGKILNVPAVLIVKITGAGVTSQPTGLVMNGSYQYDYKAWCEMSVRLISVEKAEVLGVASYSATRTAENQNNTAPAIYFAATRLAAALPAKGLP